jgi:hypothetical protein
MISSLYCSESLCSSEWLKFSTLLKTKFGPVVLEQHMTKLYSQLIPTKSVFGIVVAVVVVV